MPVKRSARGAYLLCKIAQLRVHILPGFLAQLICIMAHLRWQNALMFRPGLQ